MKMTLSKALCWLVLLLPLLRPSGTGAAERSVRPVDMSVLRGETGRLQVLLDAQGNERDLRFSLCYDTNLLTFVQAVRGRDATNFDAALTVSTNQAATAGQVGLNLVFPAGPALAAGSKAIVEAVFRAATGSTAATTTVMVCSAPVPLGILDANASALSVFASNATVALVTNCAFTLTRTTIAVSSGASTNGVGVSAPGGCAWGATVAGTNSWITLGSGANGTGSGNLNFRVAANPGTSARSGNLTIAAQRVSVTQAGIECAYQVSPATRTHGTGAATNSVSLTTDAPCAWSVINTNPWITIVSMTTGVGNTTVDYRIPANTSTNVRVGAVRIAGELFVLTQLGVSCDLSLSPPTRSHGHAATTGSVSVVMCAGSAWSVNNTNDWITITSANSGTGNGAVAYAVAANDSTMARTGVVLIGSEVFTLLQSGTPCAYALSPSGRTHSSASETGLVNVTTLAGCAWTTINTNSWITITSGTNGVGNGGVGYRVETNAGTLARAGVLVIAGKNFAVAQEQFICSYKISPVARTHGYGSSTGMLSVTTSGDCAWNVANTNDWITITSVTNNTGSGSVSYLVAPNPRPGERTGVVRIDGQFFTLTQRAAPCELTISPEVRAHGYGTATGSVSLATLIDCPWSVTNTNDWITILTHTNSSGPTTLLYLVRANPSASERTGVVTIGDQALTLTQRAAPCTFVLSTTNRTHGYSATTGSVSVATPNGCPWTVVNTNDWIRILTGTNGDASKPVGYAIDANPARVERMGTVIIADQMLTLTQRGTPCTVMISPSARVHGHGGSIGTVSVTAAPGCAWGVVNTNDWILIAPPTNGTESATVGYTVQANPLTFARTGVVMIADEVLTLSQRAAPCDFTITPSAALHGHGAETGRVSVAASGSNCPWTVSNANNWIFILSGTNGLGDRDVSYRMIANPLGIERIGLVLIADQLLTVRQAGIPCTYAIAPTNRVLGAGPEAGTVSVKTLARCSWTPRSDSDWIVLRSSNTVMGNGSVSYTAQANPTAFARTGIVSIAGQTLTLRQAAAACAYALSTNRASHAYGGGAGQIGVTTRPGCSWDAVNTNSWITITAGTEGTSNGIVSYAVASNTMRVARTGAFQIAGQTIAITQSAAPCEYELSSNEAHYGFVGGSGEFGVTNLSGCSLDAVAGNTWLKITAAPRGTNNGIVRYSVASNGTVLARSAAVVIGNQRFTVSQQGLRDIARPGVRITSPAPNARTTNWIVSGTALDDGSVAAVKVRLGDGEPLTADGTSAWSINLAGLLVPGTNVLRVQAVDLATNESVIVTQRFVFIATSALTVRTNGSGSVTPSLNGRRLEVGRAYALTAVPGAGYVFSNWTGGLTAGNSPLNFIMKSNQVLNANFVSNPFLPIKGTYNGLFMTAELDHQSSGAINLVLTDRGTFSASLLTGGRRLAFTGAFNLDGLATVTVPRPGTNALTVELILNLAPGATSLTGGVRDEMFAAALIAERAAFHPITNPATNFAGRYTVILPGDTDSAAAPGGDGIGVLTVNPAGLVNFTGTLADGTPVTQRVPLSSAGGWPLYAPLYRGKGSLLSAIALTNLFTGDLEGEFRWIKPAMVATRSYPDGFAHRAALTGSRYVTPGSNKILNISDGSLTFSGGNLEASFTNHITLGAGNRITTSDGNPVTLKFAVPTGLANGTIGVPGTNKVLTFRGVVHQKQNRASGYFLGTDQSGRLSLEP